jgi:hypothetical protein
MYLNTSPSIVLKLQTSLHIPAAFLRKIAAAAQPVPQRRYRPLFPLRAAVLSEAAADKSANGGSTSRASRRTIRR